MGCDYCNPDAYDYGFDLPDERVGYIDYHPDESVTVITICIKRVYKTCECGQGTDYDCHYDVKVDGTTECTLNEENKAHAYINAAYPNAEVQVEEDDGEAGLRRAEGWG